MRNRPTHFVTITAITLMSLSISGCLKTRAQVKEESQDSSSNQTGNQTGSQPTQVKDVDQGHYALDEIKGELTRMTGRIEDLERSSQQNSATANQAAKEDLKKIETRIVELEQAQANMLAAIKQLQEAQTIAADPQEAYEKAKASFDAKNYDAAIEQLTTFLKASKGKASEDAVFMRGESYFQLKQYQKAIVDFSKFPEKYTRSNYMPRCLLRIGQSFDALGMKDDAAGFYQELADKYPKSPEAKKIKKKVK